MGKLSKLLDWRREWFVPGSLSYTDFVDYVAIIYLPLWMLVHYTWGRMLILSWGVLQPGAQLTSCSGMKHRASVRKSQAQQSSAQGHLWPSWPPTAALQVTKNLLWGRRNNSSQMLWLHPHRGVCSLPRLEREQECNSSGNSQTALPSVGEWDKGGIRREKGLLAMLSYFTQGHS